MLAIIKICNCTHISHIFSCYILPKCCKVKEPEDNQHHAPPAQQRQQIVHLNWSYFEPEFSGKPDEDAEAHLLYTNNWMTAHHL